MCIRDRVTYPYNPDADGSQLIGVTDLQSLLALYGQQFESSSFAMSSDSSIAFTNVGVHDYFVCRKACRNLEGQWEVLRFDVVGEFSAELEAFALDNNTAGFHTDVMESLPIGGGGNVYFSSDYGEWGTNGGNGHWEERNCICQTSTKPYIEYSLCEGGTYGSTEALQECIEEKLAQGWIPLGGVTRGGNASLVKVMQAFWRPLNE